MSHRKRNNKGHLYNNRQPDVPQKTTQQEIQLNELGFYAIWKKYWMVWLGVVVLTLLVYVNSFSNSFVSDDIGGIVQNPHLNDFGYLFSSPLRALRSFLPTIQYLTNQIFGLSPAAFRATNIMFHLGVVTLVFFTIARLINPTTGIIAALLTGVHPIMTESVTWISGGGHSLYTLFSWVSILFLVISKNRNKYIILTIFFCFAAITISEKAIILPLALLLFVWVYKIRKIRPIEVGLLLGPAFIIGIIFLSKLSERSAWLQSNFYQTGQNANSLIQIPIAISSYLQLIFWPNLLTLYHSEMTFSTFRFIFYLLIFLLYLGITVYSFFRNKKTFIWLAVFFIGLIPTLTPWGVSWIVAERYGYFSAIGIFVFLGMFFAWLIGKNKGIGWTVIMLIVVCLSVRTITRNADWKNLDTLWVSMIRTSPSSPQNHNNLGDMYSRHGNLNQAVEEFNKAIQLNPNYADAYHNLGNTYLQLNKYDLAIQSFQKAVFINPNIWQSYANMGEIYYQEKKYTEAEEVFLKALKIVSGNDQLYTDLGMVYLSQNKYSEAIASFKRALEINRGNELAIAGMDQVNKIMNY